MIWLYILIGFAGLIFFFITIKCIQLMKGKKRADYEVASFTHEKITSIGEVKKFSLMPLIDFKAVDSSFKTEPGVSYLIKADDTDILLDLGFNKKKEHPSPLLHNMEKVGFALEDIDMIYISHLHLDHLGGMAEQKKKEFSFSHGDVDIPAVPVYSPEPLKPSRFNPNHTIHVNREPFIIQDGIVSMGVIPRYLFMMGYTAEQNIAINLKGKGLVIIVGCGHQRIEKIIERARMLFDVPVYAIIGGLHFPVKGGRIMAGPINLQYIVGSDTVPWRRMLDNNLNDAIKAIKDADPQIVSLSAHDSSDWAIDQFKEAFGEKYRDLRVGDEIIL